MNYKVNFKNEKLKQLMNKIIKLNPKLSQNNLTLVLKNQIFFLNEKTFDRSKSKILETAENNLTSLEINDGQVIGMVSRVKPSCT